MVIQKSDLCQRKTFPQAHHYLGEQKPNSSALKANMIRKLLVFPTIFPAPLLICLVPPNLILLSMSPCSFIFVFAPFPLSSWHLPSWTSLYVQVYSEIYGSNAAASKNPSFSAFPSFLVFYELIIACSRLCFLGSIIFHSVRL